MKLSTYAKTIGVGYQTARNMFRRGEIEGYQLPTGTIIITELDDRVKQGDSVALYGRVSSRDQTADLDRQMDRLRSYAAHNGYKVSKEVKEIASGLNDKRPKFLSLLSDKNIGLILVEHKDRATRFGFNYISALLESSGRKIEVINDSDTKNELVDDFISIVTSMCARIYGSRKAKRKTDAIRAVLDADQ